MNIVLTRWAVRLNTFASSKQSEWLALPIALLIIGLMLGAWEHQQQGMMQ